MEFRLRADDGPLLVAFRSSLYPINLKKQTVIVDPLWQNFLDPRMGPHKETFPM